MTRPLYLDTNVFIKAIETADAEAEIAWSILQAIASDALKGLTSELTLAEVLPKPIAAGADELVRGYQEALRSGAGLTVVPVSRAILLASAEIRSRRPEIRLPDAIHLATALDRNCAAFLSNDRRLRPAGDLQVIPLSSAHMDELKTLTA